MNTPRIFRLVLLNIFTTVLTVAIIAAIALTGMRVMAQDDAPDGPVITAPAGSSQGDGLMEVNVPLVPASLGGDGAPKGLAPVNPDVLAAIPSGPDGALATFSYFRLVGTAFNPRTSTTTYAYNFNGCIYENGGTDNRFMAPLLIPEGSVIKYLRLFYDDTNAGSDLTAWLTRYQPGVTSEDLTSVNSAGSSGYGSTLSAEITHTVDLTSWAYTIIVAPNANAASNSFCGIRVAYYAPLFGYAFMPSVQRNYHP